MPENLEIAKKCCIFVSKYKLGLFERYDSIGSSWRNRVENTARGPFLCGYANGFVTGSHIFLQAVFPPANRGDAGELPAVWVSFF